MATRPDRPIKTGLLGAVALAFLAAPLSFAASAELREPKMAVDDIMAVSGDQTPSGFDVPRFVSLKFSRVNARTGPSRNHSVAYQYRRRGLPLIVVAETEMWRKVRDIHGDEAWVRKPALSGERYAIAVDTVRLYARPSHDARTMARIEAGAMVRLESCERDDFCRIRTENGLKGFAPRASLWGAQPIR